MRYLCVIYNEAGQPDAGRRDMRAPLAELRRKGHVVTAYALPPGDTAATIRVRGGRLSTTEGPATASAAQLRAVVVIEALDLNDAIRVASRMPEAGVGSIEIRPTADPE